MLRTIFYLPFVNYITRSILKPFAKFIPVKFRFPINGEFWVKGNNVPPFKMVTNPTNAVTKYLFWGDIEGFEFSSVKVFCELVKDSNLFLDIGSNIGYYSLLASSIKKGDIEVHAFEPMPSIYSYLEKNVVLNDFKNINTHKMALSDGQGKAVFYSIVNEKYKSYPQLTGDGGLSSTHSGNRTKVNFDVEIDTLDNFVHKFSKGKSIDLIKLDTEANEHKVLAGGDKVLSEHRPIFQCEVLKNQIESELHDILSKYDYLYYRTTDKGLVKVENFSNNQTSYMDYYLVPKEKEGLVARFVLN